MNNMLQAGAPHRRQMSPRLRFGQRCLYAIEKLTELGTIQVPPPTSRHGHANTRSGSHRYGLSAGRRLPVRCV